MKKLVKKSVKIIGIVAGSLLSLLILLTLIVNFIFKDQVIRIVIDQLNKQVDAKINIQKVDFSIWKQFPNASVQFDNVFAQSSNQFKLANNIDGIDTLLKAKNIFFEFNLLKLIRGKYELKKINIKDGFVKLVIDKEGKANYNIIKPGKSNPNTTFSLELKDLVFTNTVLEYNNLRSSVKIIGLAERLKLKGNFQSKIIDLNINTSLYINELEVSDFSYLVNKHIELTLNLNINQNKYQFNDAKISIVNCSFDVTGDMDLNENASINITAKGRKLNLSQVINALPDNVQKKLTPYKAKGQVSLIFSAKGPISKSESPVINVSYSFKDATLTHISTGIELKNLNLTGTFTNRLSKLSHVSDLKINKFSSNLGSGYIRGNGSLENFTNPYVKTDLNYKLDLLELKQFLNIDTLEILSGSIEGNILASGLLKPDHNHKMYDFGDLVISGQSMLHEAGIKVKNSEYYFEHINGSISLQNDLYFNNISLFVLDNDFLINGRLNNGLNYIFRKSTDLTLQAMVTSRKLDLSKYFANDKKPDNSGYSRELLFPEHLNLDVKLNINSFKLNKFSAQKAVCNLSYKPTMFVLKAVSFETLTGKVNGNGVILQDIKKNFIVKGQVDITKLDIKQMFYTFNNFSQDVLKDQHLKGKVTGKIGISSEWNNSLVLNKDNLLVDADIVIDNGELVNFEPMMGLSRFVSVDELKNIKFSTLKNHIYIKEKQIIIPQMDVKSSAFDITASGNHLFDNHYTYKLRILLSDILWGKAKKAKRENEEFGEVEDDGLGKTSLFLSISGFNKDYKITYDSKKALGAVKQTFKKQGAELKSALNEEFGWFKKDSTISGKKKKTKFKVQWDDATEDKTQLPVSPEKNQPKEKIKKSDSEKAKIEWE
jgi:hypothetical protein